MIKKYEFIGVFYPSSVDIELSDAGVPIVGVIQYDDRLIIVVAEDLTTGQETTMTSTIENYDINGLATNKAKRLEDVQAKTGTVIDAGGDDTGEQTLIDLILAATTQAELDAVVDTRT